MNTLRSVCACLAGAGLLAACASVDFDGTDRNAFFFDGRIRETLEGTSEHDGTHVELGWNSVEGDTDEFNYALSTLTFGVGLDRPVGEKGWAGVAGGIGWQHSHLDLGPSNLGNDDNFGPYVAIQGGWMATPWFEPYARADLGLYFPDSTTTWGVEAGARFHVVDHMALFAGWRFAHFDRIDAETITGPARVQLDASGLVVGVEVSL